MSLSKFNLGLPKLNLSLKQIDLSDFNKWLSSSNAINLVKKLENDFVKAKFLKIVGVSFIGLVFVYMM
jgi:hypothetical protein